MSRRRAKRRRTRSLERPDGIMQMFFKDGDPTRPRHDLITRAEMWRALEWYHEQVVRQNTWRHRLWRSLRRWPSIELNPFAVVRVARMRAERARAQNRGDAS